MTAALAPLAAELERHLGLDPAAVGERLLARAVAARQTVTGSASPADYRARLTDAERAELAEEVVVSETWFLRYPESFRYLAEVARAHRGPSPLRVLCAPCSTGEEAYSGGVDAAPTPALAGRCRRRSGGREPPGPSPRRGPAVYADASAFREADWPGRSGPAGFARAAGGRFANAAPRRGSGRERSGSATWRRPGFLSGEPPFDALFCRNLFIYLTPAARSAATANLLRLLAPNGVLYLGHAEPLGLTDDRVRPVPPPQAFAFARAAAPVAPAVFPSLTSPPKAQGRPSLGLRPQPPLPPPPDPLAAARVAADRGDPAAAIALLAAVPESADAFALLGVARAMAGDPAAADAALTQALFLDPTHADALLHRLTLAEARGDTTAAAQFRRRLARRAP